MNLKRELSILDSPLSSDAFGEKKICSVNFLLKFIAHKIVHNSDWAQAHASHNFQRKKTNLEKHSSTSWYLLFSRGNNFLRFGAILRKVTIFLLAPSEISHHEGSLHPPMRMFFYFFQTGIDPSLILEIIWHFFLKNHPQNTPKMHCEEVLDRNMWLLASLSSVVLSTQPSHFAIDLRCYIHTGLLCSDLFKINHYKSYLEGNIGFFQLR